MMRRFAARLAAAAVIAGSGCAGAGAGALLHPARHRVVQPAPPGCDVATFAGAGVRLEGWRCATTAARRGAIIYLHGIADNRTSAVGIIHRFVPRGFDVVAFDSRAHGESDGDACTYGFYEKEDLRRVLDTIPRGPIVTMGTSLGAAVALQEAADDNRVTAVVAAETFSDLRTIATERAPFFFTAGSIREAFRRASAEGHFDVDAVSPENAAARITAPVLLIHGGADIDTRPEHSRRVLRSASRTKAADDRSRRRPQRIASRGGVGRIENWIDRVIQSGPTVG